jgi:hypothetical protein
MYASGHIPGAVKEQRDDPGRDVRDNLVSKPD